MLMSEPGISSAARSIEVPTAVLGNEPYAVAADRLRRCFAQASVQHAAVASTHDSQPLSAKYCEVSARRASVSSRRLLAATPPSTNVTAASDCAMAIAPVRLGKNPGEEAASNSSTCSAPSAIGAAGRSVIATSVARERCAPRADSTLAVE